MGGGGRGRAHGHGRVWSGWAVWPRGHVARGGCGGAGGYVGWAKPKYCRQKVLLFPKYGSTLKVSTSGRLSAMAEVG
eukprot:4283882-Prymnesium_polylepis.1